MSWLSDHVFGRPKDTSVERAESEISVAAPELQNDTTGGNAPTESTYENREVVAEWQVPIKGKLHKLEFEHGTTSGKRILWVDGAEAFRRDWMFKLVGDDTFLLDELNCVLRVDPAPGFKYKYSLFVDGKPLEQFKQRQAKSLRIWETNISDKDYRIVLEKDTLNVFLNGTLREEEGEFTDTGTETTWEEDGNTFILSARNSGNKHDGLLHKLTINGDEIVAIKSE